MCLARLKRIFIIAPAALFLTGCLYNNVLEFEPNQSFQGLDDAFKPNGSLNVVFVHGMGHHPFGEEGVLEYQQKIAKALGFDEAASQDGVNWGSFCKATYERYGYFSEKEKKLLDSRREASQAVCPLKINKVVVGFVGWRQYRSPESGKTLNLFELSWDRATERLQKTLLELDDDYHETVELDEVLNPIDGGRDREADRALLNRWLKQFVNQKLGDPVIYLGAYGSSIRRVVAEGLSMIAAAAGTQGKYTYSIVSDSLGSRVVFDTLGCALDGTGGEADGGCEYLHTKTRSAVLRLNTLRSMARNTAQVFMNANQLPFLALSNVRPPAADESEEDWLNRFPCESGGPGLVRYLEDTKRVGNRVQIVAFTDPNDALSYHLTQRFRKKCTHLAGTENRPVDFINVRISNVKWDFGLFANPQKAHSDGFRTNNEAVELLVHGHRGKGGNGA